MKFICKQESLSKALNTVSKALFGRTTIPILKGILLQAKDNTLILTTSDIDITIEKVIEAEVIKEGELVITAKLLIDLIRKLPKEDITFELKENNNVSVSCNKSKFNLLSLSADEYPLDKEINSEISISLNVSDFSQMIRKTSFAASVDETKGNITGVLLEIKKDLMSLVATDGYRMALSEKEIKNDKEEKIIVLAKFLNEINKILLESEDEEVLVRIEKNKAIFVLEDTKIFVRLLEGDFIDYNKIIPKDLPTNVFINRSSLIESIDRASIFSREGKHNLIKFTIKEDVMEITSRSEEGNVLETLDIEKTGNELEVGFNSKYLIDGLKIYDGENIKIELNTSVTPCLVKEKDEKTTYLILPVRLNGSL